MAAKVPNQQTRAPTLTLEALEARCVPARVLFDEFGKVTETRVLGNTVGPVKATIVREESSLPVQTLKDTNLYHDLIPSNSTKVLTSDQQFTFFKEHIPNILNEVDIFQRAFGLFDGKPRATTISSILIDQQISIADLNIRFSLISNITAKNCVIVLVSPEGVPVFIHAPDESINDDATIISVNNITIDDDITNKIPFDSSNNNSVLFDGRRYSRNNNNNIGMDLNFFNGKQYPSDSQFHLVTTIVDHQFETNSTKLSVQLDIATSDLTNPFAGKDESDTLSDAVSLFGKQSSYLSANGFFNNPSDVDYYIIDLSALTEPTVFNLVLSTNPKGKVSIIENGTREFMIDVGKEFFTFQPLQRYTVCLKADFPQDQENLFLEYTFELIKLPKIISVTDEKFEKEFILNKDEERISFLFAPPLSKEYFFSVVTLSKTLSPNISIISEDGLLVTYSESVPINTENQSIEQPRAICSFFAELGQKYFIDIGNIRNSGELITVKLGSNSNAIQDDVGETIFNAGILVPLVNSQFKDYVFSQFKNSTINSRTDSDWYKFLPEEFASYTIFVKIISDVDQYLDIQVIEQRTVFPSKPQKIGMNLIVFPLEDKQPGQEFFIKVTPNIFDMPFKYILIIRTINPTVVTPNPNFDEFIRTVSIALNDNSFLVASIEAMSTSKSFDSASVFEPKSAMSIRMELQIISISSGYSISEHVLNDLEILQGSALDIIASGAIDQLALFAGKGPADMPPEFWRLVAWAADGVSQAPSGFSLMGERLLRLGEGSMSAVSRLPDGFVPMICESAGRTPTTMELVADAVFLPAEPTGIFIGQAGFRRHWLEAAIVIISSAGATAFGWPPRRDRDKTHPLQADGHNWN